MVSNKNIFKSGLLLKVFNASLDIINGGEKNTFLLNAFMQDDQVWIKELEAVVQNNSIDFYVRTEDQKWNTVIVAGAFDVFVRSSVDFYIYDKTNPKAYYVRMDLRNGNGETERKILFKDNVFMVDMKNEFYEKPWWKVW